MNAHLGANDEDIEMHRENPMAKGDGFFDLGNSM